MLAIGPQLFSVLNWPIHIDVWYVIWLAAKSRLKTWHKTYIKMKKKTYNKKLLTKTI